jgi:tRNA modification GTPase
MAVFHPAPHSYTGENLAEISCHGNPLIVERILDVIGSTHLARIAENGEFTKRAFMNEKIDLAQAEAVGALIRAGSSAGIEMASSLLDGNLSRTVGEICDHLFSIIAEIEASFVTDDVDVGNESIVETLDPIVDQIDSLLEYKDAAPGFYSGISTTIAGLPNAGKSSLFNAILGYPRAIVHAQGGTTRDIIREYVTINGINFIFHDTAGIRNTSSGPEKIGVSMTIQKLEESDLVLYVVDARKGLQSDELRWLGLGKKTIVIMNKIDLLKTGVPDTPEKNTAWISAKYNKGIDTLTGIMTETFPSNPPKVFIQRHTILLEKARSSLELARKSAQADMTADVITIDLSDAVKSLRQIIGKEVDEDILGRIFSQFCVGK